MWQAWCHTLLCSVIPIASSVVMKRKNDIHVASKLISCTLYIVHCTCTLWRAAPSMGSLVSQWALIYLFINFLFWRWGPWASIAWPHKMVAAKPQTQKTQGQANISTTSASGNCTASGLAADPANFATSQYSTSCSQLSGTVSCHDAAGSVICDASTLHCKHITTGTDSVATYSHIH